jgi:uncharacterized protein (DUF885 family)
VDLGLERLADDYLTGTLTADPFAATVAGVPGYEAEVPDPSRAAELDLARRLDAIAERAGAIDPSALDPADRTTRAVLLASARNDAAQRRAALEEFAVTATTVGAQTALVSILPRAALATGGQARDYLARCGKLGGWLDGVAERYRQAARAGRTPTERGTRQAIAQIDGMLLAPVEADPLVAAAAGRPGLRAEVAEAVAAAVRPALRRLRVSLQEQVLPVSRPDERVGVCFVPGGREGYAAAVRAHTTTTMTPRRSTPSASTWYAISARSWPSSAAGCSASRGSTWRSRGCATTRRCASARRTRSSRRSRARWPGRTRPSPTASTPTTSPSASSPR